MVHQANLATVGPIRHAGDVAELGARYLRSPIYIHPSALPPEGWPPDFVDEALEAGYQVKPARLAPWLAITTPARERPLGVRRVDVALLGHPDDSSGLAECSPGELLEAVELYESLLGVPYRWSPGTTGAYLMRAVHRGPQATRLEAGREPVPPATDGATETDFHWVRELSAEERRRSYVHALDCNGRYLASCSSIELGFGEPRHLRDLPPSFDFAPFASRPGYWRAELVPAPDGLPDPFDPIGLGRNGAAWYATPTMALALELGRLKRISEAYLWPAQSRFLTPWYARLRDARTYLLAHPSRPGAAAALLLLKRTYTIAIGYLAGHFHGAGDDLYRPDWRHQVIARARANLYRRILLMATPPFAVDVDCIYVASDAASPEEAGDGLPLGAHLGDYKPAGRAPMYRVLRFLDEPGAADPLAMLRRAVAG